MSETPATYATPRNRDRAVALACGYSEAELNQRPELVHDIAMGKRPVPLVRERVAAILEKTAARLLTNRAYQMNPQRTRDVPPLQVEFAVIFDNCWPEDVPAIMRRIEAEARHIVCPGALDESRSYPHLARLETEGIGLAAVTNALRNLRPTVGDTTMVVRELRNADGEGQRPTGDEQIAGQLRREPRLPASRVVGGAGRRGGPC